MLLLFPPSPSACTHQGNNDRYVDDLIRIQVLCFCSGLYVLQARECGQLNGGKDEGEEPKDEYHQASGWTQLLRQWDVHEHEDDDNRSQAEGQ